MEIQEIIQLLTTNGFSMVVAIWSLKFTFDNMSKAQEKTNENLEKLTEAVTKLVAMEEGKDDKQ